MLPPWVIDEIRREEQRRREKSDDTRRLPPPNRERSPRPPVFEETEAERDGDSSRVPVVVDIYGNDTPEDGVGDVVIR